MLSSAKKSYFPMLREIRGIDCPTPKCLTNASCTGRVAWEPSGQFWIEFECADCHESNWTATPATQRLGQVLGGADPAAQEALIREFVQTRPEGPHPLRDP